MTGVLWIDEASQFAIGVESFFRDDLDRIGRGSSIRAERTLVSGDAWPPSPLEINMGRNFAFGKSAHFLNTMKFDDYKKFTVEVTVRVPQP
jgi:hypothetical protein